MAAVGTRDGLSVPEGEAASRTGFLIDGEHYSLPTLDTITLDEERVLYIYADTVLQDFVPAHPESTDEERAAFELLQMRKLRNPDFKRALAHIAYRRKHPEVEDSEIQVAIGKANALEVDIAMLRGNEDSPPAPSSQNEQPSKSDISDRSKLTGSGSHTEITSAPADASPEPTGTIASETSSPGVVPIASVR